MSDRFTVEEWTRLRNSVLAAWIGFVFATGAMVLSPARWTAGLLIFFLISGSYLLNLGRKIFAPASVVIVCLSALYLMDLWPGTDTLTRITALLPH